MAEQGVKFIRVRGKVVPIKADKYKGNKLDLRTNKTRELARKTGIYRGSKFMGILKRSERKASTKERFKHGAIMGSTFGGFLASAPLAVGLLEGSKKLVKGGLIAGGIGAALGFSAGYSNDKYISEKKFSKERKKAIIKGLKSKTSV